MRVAFCVFILLFHENSCSYSWVRGLAYIEGFASKVKKELQINVDKNCRKLEIIY